MTVAIQRMFGILERWNNNQVTPFLSKPHELSYRFNTIVEYMERRMSVSNLSREEVENQRWNRKKTALKQLLASDLLEFPWLSE